jgi:peptidoglycan-N-acetylglucosamine deacetylase
MIYWHISGWLRRIYSNVLWNIPGKDKKIYLTFDDGPTPGITEGVLKILDEYNAKATFFCLGRNVERHPEVFEKIVRAGHSVGNHTYSHLRGWKTGNEHYLKDIELADQFIGSKLFRPPYGQIKPTQVKILAEKYRIILWEVMSHDYESRISKECSLKAVLRYTKESSIVVFHDSVKAWPKLEYILPKVLEEFKGRGYGFERLG